MIITWKSIIKDKIGGHDFVPLGDDEDLVGWACKNCNLSMTFAIYHLDQLDRYQSMVGPGWAPLVEQALAFCLKRGIIITDIKEKYGALDIFTDYYDDDVAEMIDSLYVASRHMCEKCGKPGKPRPTGWIKTLCFKHYIGNRILRKWSYFKYGYLTPLVIEEFNKFFKEKNNEK